MVTRLAQIISLITYGNEYLSLPTGNPVKLFHLYSTFQNVAFVTFRKQKMSAEITEKISDMARNPAAWFSRINAEEVKYLKLDFLNLQGPSPPFAMNIFTADNNWVIQADHETCRRAHFGLVISCHLF